MTSRGVQPDSKAELAADAVAPNVGDRSMSLRMAGMARASRQWEDGGRAGDPLAGGSGAGRSSQGRPAATFQDAPTRSGNESGLQLSPEAIKNAVAEAIARGDTFRDLRSWPQARDAYRSALLLDPKLQPIWVQLGHAAKEGGDLLDAEAAYREAIVLNPQDPDAHLQLGHLLKLRG